MQLFGRRYDTGQPVVLEIAGTRIRRLMPVEAREDALEDWPWVSPGLFDLQANGYRGQEFSSADLTPEKVAGIARAYLSFGVTRFCPTLTTESFDVLRHGLEAIDRACESSPALAGQIVGVHLEGPYIAPENGPRGAHPRQHCRRPDWDEFQRLQDAAGGRIRVHTLSVEFEESAAFVRKVAASGVLVAIGHTSADSDQIRRAADAGARLSTHLGNGCHRLIHRHSSYIWDQLAEDRLAASLIVDGHHLPPQVVKTFVRAKTAERCVLVSDMSGMAGQPPGRYATHMSELEILPDGRLVVAGQRELLAGASLPIGTGIANVMRFAGVDLPTAVRMATDQPAKLLGIEAGGLEPEDPANLVQFDLVPPADDRAPGGLGVRATVLEGELAWGTPWHP